MKTLLKLKAGATVKRSAFAHYTTIALLFALPFNGMAQEILAPETLFQYACPQATFNDFEIAIQIEPSGFLPDNVFFIELSDKNGDFSTPVVLEVIEGKNEEPLFYSKFGFDETVYGDAYRIRVRSTSPELTSPVSDAFEAHYIRSTFLTLNNFEDIALCGPSSSTVVSLNADSSLIYHWFKDGVFYAEGGSDLALTEPGLYYAETYLGICTGLAYSNVINVSQPEDSSPVAISPSEVFELEVGAGQLFTATGLGSFKWYNEKGDLMSTEASVSIDKAGVYTIVATNGSCELSKELVVTQAEPMEVVAEEPAGLGSELLTGKDTTVPSFVSPNGDNINDKWVLPSEYANDPSVRVSIYTASGSEVFSTDNYQNNWPQQGTVSGKSFNSVVYYLISKQGRALRKGSITMM